MSNARDKANIPALNFSSTGIDDNATSTAITIDSSERVGISETDNSTYVLGKKLVLGELENNDGITLKSSTTTHTNYLAFADADSGLASYRGFFGYNHTGDSMRFGTYSTERMRIDSSGNVGIGTGSPDAPLTVKEVSNVAIHVLKSNDTSILKIGEDGGGNAVYNATSGGQHIFQDTSTERMRIDSSGNVGIGTSSPKEKLDSRGAAVFSGDHVTSANAMGTAHGVMITSVSGSGKITAISNGANDVNLELRGLDGGSANANQLVLNGGANAVIFGDSSNTSPATSSTATHSCFKNGGSKLELSASSNPCLAVNRVNSEGTAVELRQAGGLRGSISVAGATASFNTSSDYRLKENVDYDFDATTRLKELKPARFNFIADANKTVDGFLAHEVSSVVPEAITGTKDAVDDDGNIQPQQIDQAKLVPLLVKTIQELEARITTLEANNP